MARHFFWSQPKKKENKQSLAQKMRIFFFFGGERVLGDFSWKEERVILKRFTKQKCSHFTREMASFDKLPKIWISFSLFLGIKNRFSFSSLASVLKRPGGGRASIGRRGLGEGGPLFRERALWMVHFDQKSVKARLY